MQASSSPCPSFLTLRWGGAEIDGLETEDIGRPRGTDGLARVAPVASSPAAIAPLFETPPAEARVALVVAKPMGWSDAPGCGSMPMGCGGKNAPEVSFGARNREKHATAAAFSAGEMATSLIVVSASEANLHTYRTNAVESQRHVVPSESNG